MNGFDSCCLSERRHSGIYDPEDDPDRLYFERGLGRLDSDDDSGDEESVGLGDLDDDWGDEDVSFSCLHYKTRKILKRGKHRDSSMTTTTVDSLLKMEHLETVLFPPSHLLINVLQYLTT